MTECLSSLVGIVSLYPPVAIHYQECRYINLRYIESQVTNVRKRTTKPDSDVHLIRHFQEDSHWVIEYVSISVACFVSSNQCPIKKANHYYQACHEFCYHQAGAGIPIKCPNTQSLRKGLLYARTPIIFIARVYT